MAEAVYLLDSNICIYLLAGISPRALAQVERCRPGEVVTSAVAYAEVMQGIARQGATGGARAEALFATIAVLPFDRAAAAVCATLPFRRGRFDRLIAAHALALGLTFVTNNERDFVDVAGLRVENWLAP